jgi:hypothetical protein
MAKQAQVLSLENFLNDVNDGKLFTVTFVKKTDKTVRTMTCRRGVTKGVKGVAVDRAGEDARNNVLTVFDMQKLEEGKDEKGAFRRINLEQLVSLKHKGKQYAYAQARQEFVEIV